MAQKDLFITAPEGLNSGAMKNPVMFLDHKLKDLYPQFHRTDYDLKLCATKAPTEVEKSFFAYNDYRERFGCADISVLRDAALSSPCKSVLLNGFRQKHLEYLAPYIRDTVELLYLFKCNTIADLSVLSTFPKLKCVLIFWNNKLETLWDVGQNRNLQVLSFLATSKLRDIESLRQSSITYITFDSSDNCGNLKPCLLENPDVFPDISTLKHLKLLYKNYSIDY